MTQKPELFYFHRAIGAVESNFTAGLCVDTRKTGINNVF